jgi:hypothetical protein
MRSATIAPLPFFTDQPGDRDEPVVTMLRPFVDCPEREGLGPNSAQFNRFFAAARLLFARVDRSAADIAVLPWDWDRAAESPARLRQARRFIRENAAAGLRTLIFSLSDTETAARESHAILFRTSLVGRKVQANEFAMPAWAVHVADISMENLPLRPYESAPTVGFCGASYRTTFREPNWFRRTFRGWRCRYERVYPKRPGLRAHILDRLRAAPGLKTNIVEREGFVGGAARNGALNMDAYPAVRQQYVENLLACDYALCARGGGNFSFRLYEALQLGRIPLFINTDCVLPWPEDIAWRKLCVWVEQAELDHLEEILLAYHAALSPPEFADRQRQCRAVWEDYLSPLGFFTTLRTWLKERGYCRNDLKT